MTPTSPTISTAHPTSAPVGRPRVLVADDSRVIRQAIKKILGTDFDVVQAENGAVAWDQLQQDVETQALITDIEMPGVDGYELICRIRGAEPERLRDLPIIAITGADDEETRRRALACGATDFITKPIDSIQLQARVRAYVRYDQTTRELTEKTTALQEQSVTDPVTGLRSRRYFVERGEQDLAFALRRKKDLTLLRIDIDNFKKHYQALGDEASDQLLTWFAKTLFATARTEDTVARIGGAEFAVIANATDVDTAAVLCTRICKAVGAQAFTHAGAMLRVTVSIGAASVGQDRCESIDAMLKLAQQRLYHAQSEGGNRFCSSVLGEAAHAVEELLMPALDAAPVVDEVLVPPLAPVPPAALVKADAELEHAVLPSLDDIAPPPVAFDSSASAETPVGTSDVPMELLSLDKALQLIAAGRGEVVQPYLTQLLQQMRPLLEFCQHLGKRDLPK